MFENISEMWVINYTEKKRLGSIGNIAFEANGKVKGGKQMNEEKSSLVDTVRVIAKTIFW